MEFQLSQQTVVAVKKGQFGPYVAVGRQKEEKPTRWVYLSEQAWQKLNECMSEVADILNKDKEEMRTLTKRVQLNVTKYKEKYYVGLHCTDLQGVVQRGRRVNMNMTEWNELVKKVMDINKAMERKTKEGVKRKGETEEKTEAKKQKTEETIN